MKRSECCASVPTLITFPLKKKLIEDSLDQLEFQPSSSECIGASDKIWAIKGNTYQWILVTLFIVSSLFDFLCLQPWRNRQVYKDKRLFCHNRVACGNLPSKKNFTLASDYRCNVYLPFAGQPARSPRTFATTTDVQAGENAYNDFCDSLPEPKRNR